MSPFRPSSLLKVGLLAALPSLLTGCSNMVTTASAPSPLSSATVSGKMHGGNQPIYNATVNLYSAGTTGYGTGSVLLGTTTTDTNGAFSFTQLAGTGTNTGTSASYYCPAAGSQLYIVGNGGNTLGTGVVTTNNAASVLMATIGKCSAASTVFVYINEITTIATLAALQQYINPGNSTTPGSMTMGTNGDYTIASPGQAGIGLNNAFALVPNLVNYTNGSANATFTQQNPTGPTSVSATVVTGTPEQAKIITMANILASCVNAATSANANCTTLFTNAVPPNPAYTSQPNATFATAIDTLQAGYYMLTNPTDNPQPATGTAASTTDTNSSTANLAGLYNLAAPMAPFQTGLSAIPSDWTIGVQYSVSSTVNTATPATGTGTCSNGSYFIDSVYGNIAVDKNGNLFLGNSATAANLAITEMSPSGLPLDCSDAVVTQARGGVTIDQANNVWAASGATLATGAGGLVKWIPSTGTGTAGTIPMQINGTTDYGTSVQADGGTHVFFNDVKGLLMYELPITASAATTAAGLASLGTATASVPAIVIDKNNTVYASSGSSSFKYYLATTPGGSTYTTTASTISGTFIQSATGLAVDALGNVWASNGSTGAGTANGAVGNSPGNTLFQEMPTYTASPYGVTFAQINQTGVSQAGLQTPRQIAIDGAGNVWTTNNNPNGNSTAAQTGPPAVAAVNAYAISQFTKNGAPLSPTQITPGATPGPTTNLNTGGYNKSQTYFLGPRGISVDLSGNVWVTSTSGSTGPFFVTQIVGAGVPTIAPISTQIKNNSFGTKP